jgi:hypothetical protein
VTLDRLYRFVQFEYPWPLGPTDGRYLIRDHAGEDAHHVLVLAAWETTTGRRPRRWGREPEPLRGPSETGLARATVVDTATVDDEAGRAWLETAAGARRDRTVAEGLRWLNFGLRAHRAATADPGVNDVTPEQALVIRAGYGAGFEVADGAWTAARDLSPPHRSGAGGAGRGGRREAALRPQERLAALLAGRDAVLACEEMVLRARLDLAAGRPREAALQAHLAVEAAVAELQAFVSNRVVAERLPDLEAQRESLAAAANDALQGGPSDATMAAVEDGVRAVEAALRARAATATY